MQRTTGRTLLIVNGDDFGIAEGVNLGVVEAHEHGILTSTTVIANMPAFEHAAQLARDHRTLAVGAHLNLTSGSPVLPPARIPSLVRPDGRFLSLDSVLSGLTLGRLRQEDIEAELSAQVERAVAAGLAPTHLDSHHHVHMHPRMHGTVVELAKRFGIRGIRCTSEIGVGGAVACSGMLLRGQEPPEEGMKAPAAPIAVGDGTIRLRPNPQEKAEGGNPEGRPAPDESPRGVYLKTVTLSLFALLLRRRLRRAGLTAPQHFRGLILGAAFTVDELLNTLKKLPEGSVELMCHPGYVDDGLRERTSYSAGRDSELAALLDPRAREILETRGVRLGSYSDL